MSLGNGPHLLDCFGERLRWQSVSTGSLNDAEDSNHSLVMNFTLHPVPILALNLQTEEACDWEKDRNVSLGRTLSSERGRHANALGIVVFVGARAFR